MCCSFIGYMNQQEFSHIAQQHRDDLYRFAIRYSGDGDMAWDAVQEAMIKLWEHCEEVEQAKAKGYMIRVMYRMLVDQHRSQRRHHRILTELQGESWYSQHENFELHDTMQQALAQLPQQHRAILLMKDIEGYQYKEIAQLTGLEEMQVAGILYRARVNLKKILTDNN